MESTLRCLKAKADLMQATIDPDLAKEVLLCHMPTQNLLTMEDVKAMVCQYFKVDPTLLASKSRKKIHAYPRNVYVYLCRQHTQSTVEEIGRSLSRNHSTSSTPQRSCSTNEGGQTGQKPDRVPQQ